MIFKLCFLFILCIPIFSLEYYLLTIAIKDLKKPKKVRKRSRYSKKSPFYKRKTDSYQSNYLKKVK